MMDTSIRDFMLASNKGGGLPKKFHFMETSIQVFVTRYFKNLEECSPHVTYYVKW